MVVEGGCVRDHEICDCKCHDPVKGRYVSHVLPCCDRCHYCNKNIRRPYREKHEKECSEKKTERP